jgi:uncharacterized membrane protein
MRSISSISHQFRRLRRMPIWAAIVGCGILGALLGAYVGHDETGRFGIDILGSAWAGTAEQAREALVAFFGGQITVLTIVLSLNAPLIQSAANQYSPRLVPLYLKGAPILRAVPMFVLSSMYILAALRELGEVQQETVRPRLVLSGALLLVVATLGLAMVLMLRTFRFLRVEQVLGLVGRVTMEAVDRVRDQQRQVPSRPGAAMVRPARWTPLRAPSSGYLAYVDLARLAGRARKRGLRAYVDRSVGEHIEADETIGWAAADDGRPVGPDEVAALTSALVIAAARELEDDISLGIRILVDVANRAASENISDPYTACQALLQLRTVLHSLGRLPVGDLNVVDEDGSPRVQVAAVRLRELLSITVDGPLRDSDDPDVIEALLEIGIELATVAAQEDDRATVRQFLDRVLDDAARHADVPRANLQRFRRQADQVRLWLQSGPPGPEHQPGTLLH